MSGTSQLVRSSDDGTTRIYWPVVAAAEAMGISKRHAYRLREAGELTIENFDGRAWVPVDEITRKAA